MSNENTDVNTTGPTPVSDRETGQSQDAIRHQRDALHHKFHKDPEDDLQQLEGQQPEIPKVGSLDAPGG